MNREKAIKRIVELVDAARASIKSAEKLADEHNVSFDFSLTYGAGAWYEPKSDTENGQWQASSGSC